MPQDGGDVQGLLRRGERGGSRSATKGD